SAISQASSGVSLNTHLRGEAHEGTTDRNTRGGNRRLVEQAGDLLVIQTEFHPCDDELTVRFAQPLQRGVISAKHLHADGLFEWRRIGCGCFRRERLSCRTRQRTPHRIAQAIAEGLADGGAKGSLRGEREGSQ